jgi:hypothetical protein
MSLIKLSSVMSSLCSVVKRPGDHLAFRISHPFRYNRRHILNKVSTMPHRAYVRKIVSEEACIETALSKPRNIMELL